MRILFLASLALLSAAPTAALAAGSGAAEPFAVSRDPAAQGRSLECLTQAIYYEARGESEDGQRAVAQVVLNRVRHPAFPNSVCGVVYQGSTRSSGCQFSFTCTGVMGPINDPNAWDRARRIAAAALGGSVYRPVGLATNYHTTAIRPYWAPGLVRQITLGAHIFYRMPGSGTVDAFNQAPSDYEPEAGAPQPRFAAARTEMRSFIRPRRERYTQASVVEIPIVERRVVYRTLGPRPAAASAPSGRRPATRAAVIRSGPRVTIEGGVRITRG
jgi:Cell Wall Hydrolase